MGKVNSFNKNEERKLRRQKEQKRKRIIVIVAVAVAVVAIALIITGVVINMNKRTTGTIILELYPQYAPISVDNFVNYVNKGFYDGLIFHRVIEGFMIQGGDPTGTGYGDSTLTTIKGEFTSNGVNNPLSFKRGVIGMARSANKNSASSQFFICHEDSTFLDGDYASFGKVIEGLDTVDAIATCEKTDDVDSSGNHYKPARTVRIEKMYVAEDAVTTASGSTDVNKPIKVVMEVSY